MIRPLTPRILRVYQSATPEQLAEGADWYHNAHGLAASLDPKNPRRAAGVIAALSPRLSWAKNVELAGRVYAEGRASGVLGRSRRAADAFFQGSDPLDVLGGPKVRAFFTLINDPEDPKTVCIDRHAIDVALGVKLDDRSRPALHRGDAYERFCRAYRRAAAHLGCLPSTAQASTWLAWRAAHSN